MHTKYRIQTKWKINNQGLNWKTKKVGKNKKSIKKISTKTRY